MDWAWQTIDATGAVECTDYSITLWDEFKDPHRSTHNSTGGSMNIRKTLLAVTVTTLVSLSLAALAAADHNAHEKQLIQLSEEGSKAAHSQ